MNEPAYIEKDGKKIYRQPVECYTRIVGYIRPVNLANPGKQAEISDRKMFKN
jgi:anaerobic ribonucleoside-triphosphate reductase